MDFFAEKRDTTIAAGDYSASRGWCPPDGGDGWKLFGIEQKAGDFKAMKSLDFTNKHEGWKTIQNGILLEKFGLGFNLQTRLDSTNQVGLPECVPFFPWPTKLRTSTILSLAKSRLQTPFYEVTWAGGYATNPGGGATCINWQVYLEFMATLLGRTMHDDVFRTLLEI